MLLVTCWLMSYCWRQHDHLVGRRHVHVESLFGNRGQSRSARCVADFAIELHSLGLECLTPPIQLAQRARLVDSIGSPGNDARCHEDETE